MNDSLDDQATCAPSATALSANVICFVAPSSGMIQISAPSERRHQFHPDLRPFYPGALPQASPAPSTAPGRAEPMSTRPPASIGRDIIACDLKRDAPAPATLLPSPQDIAHAPRTTERSTFRGPHPFEGNNVKLLIEGSLNTGGERRAPMRNHTHP